MSTQQRIKLQDGRYCYSGPNCSWHSPSGTAAAKKEMKLANVDVSKAVTFEELQAAQERLAAAQSRFDVTPEGLQALQNEIATEDDSIVKEHLNNRRQHAEHLAAQIEVEQQKKWEASGQEGDLAKTFVGFHERKHTYKEPTFHTTGENTMYPTTTGSNYDPKNRVTDVKRLLKKDIEKAVKAGYLPAGVDYHVTANAKDNKIRLEARGIPDALVQIPEEDQGFSREWRTPEGKALHQRMSDMISSYNSDSTNSMIDYFQSSYYVQSTIESEREKKWREEETARTKRMASTRELRKELKQLRSVSSDDTAALDKYKLDFTNTENTLPSGERFSTVNGEDSVIAVKSDDRVTFHNFTSMTFQNKQTKEPTSVEVALRVFGIWRTMNRTRI